MTIKYALKRRDVWDAYWSAWRNGWSLKLAQAFIAGCVFFVALSRLAPRGSAALREIVLASVCALLSIAWLPIYPLIRFKPQTGTLTVGPEGISTFIGRHTGEVPWAAIGSVRREGERLYIGRTNGNAFAIPVHAFANPEERVQFEEEVTRLWHAARA
jgi:hypothetical protein